MNMYEYLGFSMEPEEDYIAPYHRANFSLHGIKRPDIETPVDVKTGDFWKISVIKDISTLTGSNTNITAFGEFIIGHIDESPLTRFVRVIQYKYGYYSSKSKVSLFIQAFGTVCSGYLGVYDANAEIIAKSFWDTLVEKGVIVACKSNKKEG